MCQLQHSHTTLITTDRRKGGSERASHKSSLPDVGVSALCKAGSNSQPCECTQKRNQLYISMVQNKLCAAGNITGHDTWHLLMPCHMYQHALQLLLLTCCHYEELQV